MNAIAARVLGLSVGIAAVVGPSTAPAQTLVDAGVLPLEDGFDLIGARVDEAGTLMFWSAAGVVGFWHRDGRYTEAQLPLAGRHIDVLGGSVRGLLVSDGNQIVDGVEYYDLASDSLNVIAVALDSGAVSVVLKSAAGDAAYLKRCFGPEWSCGLHEVPPIFKVGDILLTHPSILLLGREYPFNWHPFVSDPSESSGLGRWHKIVSEAVPDSSWIMNRPILFGRLLIATMVSVTSDSRLWILFDLRTERLLVNRPFSYAIAVIAADCRRGVVYATRAVDSVDLVRYRFEDADRFGCGERGTELEPQEREN